MTTRDLWVNTLERIARPVLSSIKNETFKETFPVGLEDRRPFAHLEGFSRLLMGISPWLEKKQVNKGEEEKRGKYANYARHGLTTITDPKSKNYLNIYTDTIYSQSLVELAFLSQALLRAKNELWEKLDEKAKENLVRYLKEGKKIIPPRNNWILFSAMIEAFLYSINDDYDLVRIEYALSQHQQWYKGDSFYGDGPNFHADYYNSFVIIPMLFDIIRTVKGACFDYGQILSIAKRQAEIQERIIGPDGTFPVVGRSACYRTGAMQVLAQMVYTKNLPDTISEGQVKKALTAVIRRCIIDGDNFDEDGWLKIGFTGHQPSMAETYISTGSLYLLSPIFLPLGLDEKDSFWTAKESLYTSQKIWSGIDTKADKSI